MREVSSSRRDVMRPPAFNTTTGISAHLVLSEHERAEIEFCIESLLTILDAADGDPDLGPNGDELDGSMAEDDFCLQNADWLGHPGCPISDPDEDDDPSGQCDEDGINTIFPHTGLTDVDDERWIQPLTLNPDLERRAA